VNLDPMTLAAALEGAAIAYFLILQLIERKVTMAVYPEVQDALNRIDASLAEIPNKVVAAVQAADATAAQDKTDTIAAVNDAAARVAAATAS
jgi:hypothetical protein